MSHRKKMVSIVLPVYNGEASVAEAIESVLYQTYSDIELIIVNDCSTDDTVRILESYDKDSRIRVINNCENMKLPKSLNIGFKHSKGDYLTWTSDDNRYKSNAVQMMVARLENDNRIDMVYSDYSTIDERGELLNKIVLGEPEDLPSGNVIGPCFLYTRKAADIIGEYDTSLFLAEDYEYWLRMLRYCRICHVHKDLYEYRIHPQSLTSRKTKQIRSQAYKALEKHFDYFSRELDKEKRQLFFDYYIRLADVAKKNEVRKMIYRLDRSYIYHEKHVKLKKRLRKTSLWKFLRRMKGMLLRANG